jgi:hypothetical protein
MSPLPSEPHFATRIKIEDDVEQNFVENEVVVGHRGSSTPAYIVIHIASNMVIIVMSNTFL